MESERREKNNQEERADTPPHTYSLHIVGAKHCLIGANLDTWLDIAVGSSISIMADTDNAYDPNAVGAWAWIDRVNLLVGHVGSEDCSLAKRLISASGRNSLRLKIVKRRPNGTTLLAQVTGIEPVPASEMAPDIDWSKWKSPVPLMTLPDELKHVEIIEDEVMDILDEGMEADKAEMKMKLQTYLEYSFYDISREAREARSKIVRALRQRDDADDWSGLIREFESQSGRIGTELTDGSLLKWIVDLIKKPQFPETLNLEKLPSKDDVWQALADFPLDLKNQWRTNVKEFMARIYYAAVPRKVLWSYFSTIALNGIVNSSELANRFVLGVASQACFMPENVIESMLVTIDWLRENGYEIAQLVDSMLKDELRKRRSIKKIRKGE